MPRFGRQRLGARLARRRRAFSSAMSRLFAEQAEAQAAEFVPPLPTCPVMMRHPCRACAEPRGRIERVGPNAVMRCAACGRFQYNAPKTEQIRHWGTVA